LNYFTKSGLTDNQILVIFGTLAGIGRIQLSKKLLKKGTFWILQIAIDILMIFITIVLDAEIL